MKTKSLRAWFATLLAMVFPGCGTVSTRTNGDTGQYHGFGYDMKKVSTGSEWLEFSGEGSAGKVPFLWPRGVVWILDAPLSLVVDTLLLPADALRPKTPEHKREPANSQP